MIDSLFIGNKDGGIISTITQVPQSDEPVVIIGLGGTGVDAISGLKTKLQRQIKPDNEDDVKEKGEEPKYDHIKFLGIDADKTWFEGKGLSQGETLNIQNYHYNDIFQPQKLHELKLHKELQWMSIDFISQHLPPDFNGAGAYRQFGRWLTITRANDIRMKISQVIKQACLGRNGGSLNVHIISGISGGMGAGSFVDVCYITRKVISDLAYSNAKVFGYFVLPDAIISKEDISKDPVSTASNEKNGMASLLEIEHLMNLKDSDEWFEQDYGSFQIKTQEKLVNMCHFVSASNMEGVCVQNGYEYALNVVGDYILAFVSKEQVADGAEGITMKGNLTNIEDKLQLINPEHERGYSQNYHIIGSANAEIPTTQMATYLATQLFKKLTIQTQMPNNIQIDQEFADYLNLTNKRFNQLEIQISQDVSWTEIKEEKVSQSFDFIRAHMNDGQCPLAMTDAQDSSINSGSGKLLENRKSMEKKVDSYIYEAGASSIPGLALNKLIEIIEDPTKGPIYAYGMMNKTGVDIFHYLDGRKKYCSSQKHDASGQHLGYQRLEKEARTTLANSNVFNKKKNIKEYASVLNNIAYWKARADKYAQLEILMENLETAFDDINKKYLIPLYETTKELIDTFEANSSYFEMGKGNESQDGFTKQLVKFSDIQQTLDGEITNLDSRNETGGLLKILTAHPNVWMERDELKLKAKISEYILQKFNPILSRSIESFLRKKLNMEGAPVAKFADKIESQIIDPFVNDAAPVFWTGESLVDDNQKTVHRSILTVPSSANCICQAAAQHKDGNIQTVVRKSLINDRIYILRTISGVPMFAYHGLTQYLNSYNSYSGLGLHLYERNVNWREILTFPYPYSINPKYTKNADELLKLYDEAEQNGIIFYDNNMAFVKQYKDIDPELLNLDSLKNDGKMDVEKANKRITALEEVLSEPKSQIAINSKGKGKGNKLVKDNFLRFYGIQQDVKKEVEKFNTVNKVIEDIKKEISDSQRSEDIKKKFFDALLIGLFDEDAFNISYKYVEFGMEKIVSLCNNNMPYSGMTKYYQAFRTMLDLDEAVQSEIINNVSEKFDLVSPDDKYDNILDFLSRYNPQILSMISDKNAGKLEQTEINRFYQSFNNYLKEMKVLLDMAGVKGKKNS